MSSIDLIKASIYCDTIVRKDEYNYSATKEYYDYLLQALSIEDFPLIEINTINKRTYMCESISDNRYYLVFDHYFLDCIYEIDQIVMDKHGPIFLDSFLNKTLAEECYCNRRYALSILFSGQYMKTLDKVIKEYNKEDSNNSLSTPLFIQQAFLIAHELFHYVLNKDASLLSTGIEKKRLFIRSLLDTSIKDLMEKHINDRVFLEECLCDATGMMQAIEISRSLGKMNVEEAASASAMAIMGQITISTIQEAVRKSLDISFDNVLDKSKARLMHFLAFAPQYIEERFSVEESRIFMKKFRSMHLSWLYKIQLPIIDKLITYRKDFKENFNRDSMSIEELGRTRQVLIQIFNT